jgi:hypothetical protein
MTKRVRFTDQQQIRAFDQQGSPSPDLDKIIERKIRELNLEDEKNHPEAIRLLSVLRRYNEIMKKEAIVDNLVQKLPDTVSPKRRQQLLRLGLEKVIVKRLQALGGDDPMIIRLLTVLAWYKTLGSRQR